VEGLTALLVPRVWGFGLIDDLDGQFGNGTGQAVVAFKTDEELHPNDPVASTGTIGRLDQYFAHEVQDPDFPDPSALGLVDVTNASMGNAVQWLTLAIDGIDNQFPAWEIRPDDPSWIVLNDLLERNLHVSRSSHDRRFVIEQWIMPFLKEARRVLGSASPFFKIVPMDRQGFQVEFPGQSYLPMAQRLGGELVVTPAFRNALSEEDRVANLIRFAVAVDGRLQLFAVPDSQRFERLPGDSGLNNTLAFASFAFEAAGGSAPSVLHGRFRWAPWPPMSGEVALDIG